MKIIVIGAGAMGCLYGAYLSKHNSVNLGSGKIRHSGNGVTTKCVRALQQPDR